MWDRYTRRQGRVHLTGLQALVRLTLDQVRHDRSEGRRVGVAISGYPGSPLAGFDQALRQVLPLLDEHDVRLVPAINEELAASAVGGTQLLERFPHSRYDGVVGLWYGKAPGLDRSLDAIRHCNFMGTSRSGGVLTLVGDDPHCKSSSLPSHSEHALAHAFVPILNPADAGEVLSFGLHGVTLSRFAGLWVALRVVADVADGGGIYELPSLEPLELPKVEIDGEPFRARINTHLLPPEVNRIEEEIVLARLEAARAYVRTHGLDRVFGKTPDDRVGIVASGWLFRELEEALERLGIDENERSALGIRLLKVALVYPIDPETVRSFSDGLEQIVVVDERRGFLEEAFRAALPGGLESPQVVGQRTERGEPWLARLRNLTADSLAVELGSFLGRSLSRRDITGRARGLRDRAQPRDAVTIRRAPHFCSGCPHSTSTRLPEGSIAGAGIGCHTMALLMDRGVEFLGAMGSEGAHWIGLAPYVDTPHLFQNLGDGTYFHSGRLAVRACVEAGVQMTFKLLYNGRIAMTGGQQAVGAKPVAEVVQDLLSDGVKRVIAVSDDLNLRTLARSHSNVECVSRDGYDSAMQRLTREAGVSVLVYDELCANEKQRLERRGVLPKPDEQVVIHEDVCEGCGDCGVKSACLSLHPISTPLGRKTRIHTTSCTDDRSCVRGDCPSFLTIRTPYRRAPDATQWIPENLPEPEPHAWEDGRYRLFLVGVGSTGVVTVNALLMRAAEIEGHNALHLDQTGLAQRGGRVVSHCVLSREQLTGSARVGRRSADTLLAFDPLGATDDEALGVLSRNRTIAVAHRSLSPTGEMVTHPELEPPDVEDLIGRLGRHTRVLHSVPAEAVAQAAFDTSVPANVIQLGFACQKGAVPLRPESLERAIVELGIAVEQNRAAFRLGRALAADPELPARVLEKSTPPTVAETRTPEEAEALGEPWQELVHIFEGEPESQDHRRLVPRIAGFALDLASYQSKAYARRYLKMLALVSSSERTADPTSVAVTEVAARELYRIMAYKDEYEVARLLLRGPFRRWLEGRSDERLGIRYHLHPPLLRALGLDRKVSFGRWIEPLLHTLALGRVLRGTRFDPFGRTEIRTLERELIEWYERALHTVSRHLTPETLGPALEMVSAAAEIRGFEEVKHARANEVRQRVESKVVELALSYSRSR
jgi:indolepyruvate ferredoxin oxidoreductase